MADRVRTTSGIGSSGTFPQSQFLVTLTDFASIFASWRNGTRHAGQV